MLKNDVESYLQSLRVANLSQNTIKTYKHALEKLMQFVGPETDVREIDVSVIRTLVHRLAANGMSPSSRNHALRVFKAFGKYLLDEGIVEENIFALQPHTKVPVRLIQPPSVETMNTLLDGDIPTNWPARDRAELELLYDTGVRVQEAAGITLSDLRSDGTILIHGKGGKDRLVPLGEPLRKALDAYLPERQEVLRRRKQKSEALFFRCNSPSSRNRRMFSNRILDALDVRSVRRTLIAVCQAKGLPPMHPHMLRHACATHMLDNGAPLTVIRALLGHAKLSTTAQYAFVSTGLMQKAYNSAHPSAA